MERPSIATIRGVTPMIYAYTTPEIVRHNGWTKIGYTEQDVEQLYSEIEKDVNETIQEEREISS